MTTLDDLLEALEDAGAQTQPRATSVRIPTSLHRAVVLATELGMDESFTAATNRALRDRLHSFVRRQTFVEHFREFPDDIPTLAAVAHRRIRGSAHPGVYSPELVDQAADWLTEQRPEWARTGRIDETVDEVLQYVSMLADGVGVRRRHSA